MPGVVSNSSPLIHLAKINRLPLVERLYGKIVVPLAVWREAVEEGRNSPDALQISEAKWITVMEAQPSLLLRNLQTSLGAGESEAIALALEQNANLILMDDREGRQAARSAGLHVTGLMGILLASWQRGWVSHLEPCLDDLAATGFRLNGVLRDQILDLERKLNA